MNSVESIFMVEASPELRETQQKLLCRPGEPLVHREGLSSGKCKDIDKPIVWAESLKSIATSKDWHLFHYESLMLTDRCFHISQMQIKRPS